MMSCPALLPQESFDRPELHRRPLHVTEIMANGWMNMVTNKACAGLRADLRVSGVELRQAFMENKWGKQAKATWFWMLPSLRDDQVPLLYAIGALTLYEIARGARLFGANGGGLAAYLNQWAKKPDLVPPSAGGRVLVFLSLTGLPKTALDYRQGDPRRKDYPQHNASHLDVGGLVLRVPLDALRRHQAKNDSVAA